MNKIDDCLNLSPIIKDYIEYQLLEQDEEKGKYTIKSGMNFITGLWGSGKTFFIEEILNYLNKDYLGEKKLIRIDFSPRNLETTKSIYSHFLDTFIGELLSKKYDPNLKGYKSNLLRVLGSETGNTYFNLLFKFFNSPSENVQDILESINNSLKTTYKDYFVVIVIDDIDRVEKKDLLNIGKILNLLKNLTSIQKEDKDKSAPNLICLYSADSNYLNNFYLGDRQEEKGINFYQYFNKFRDSQIDIYDTTYENLTTFLANSIIEIKDNKESRETRYLCRNLCDSLKEKDIAVTIRDLLFLKKEILEKFQQNINKAKENLEKYNDIIPEESINSYFYSGSNRIDIFSLYLYIKSVYEKETSILSDLKFYYSKNLSWSEELSPKDLEVKEIKDKHSFIFKDLNLANSGKDKCNLIEKLIRNQNDSRSFSIYILDSWRTSILEKLEKPNFDNIDRFPQIVNRLFFPFEHTYTSSIMYDIIQNISNYRSKDDHGVFSNFFDNYIQIIRKYFSLLGKHNWKDTEREKGFINATVYFFGTFTDINSFPIVNIQDPDGSLKKERSEKIKGLLKEIQEKDDIVYQFMFLYLILRTHSYSKQENKKDLEELIESFSPSEIVNNSKIVNNEEASILNLTKKFLKIPSNISCDDKVFIETLWILLYDLIHRDGKDLPLLKRFGEENSLLLLIYSMICNVQLPIQFFLGEQDEEQKECYKKIYQELVKSKGGDIKDLIKKYKDKILIRNGEVNHPREAINIKFLRNLEDKISIEKISDSLNSFYGTDSN
ncbi:hypothetical protein BSK20_02690 [SR1 bacterium human oral taxon HOT-345]|nr:hypothetical protein BSK20_02690 [SR1 bacterium human oral taxon HOT-345]